MGDHWNKKMKTYFTRIDFDKDGSITRADFEGMAKRFVEAGKLGDGPAKQLSDNLFAFPKTKGEWRQIADMFNTRWQLPHCLGALDGKHVQIRCPRRSGSTYFNYRKQFSVVLMALVDSDYQLRYIDVGVQGRISDAGMFTGSRLDRALRGSSKRFPQPDPLPGDERKSKYFVVGDDAFALQEHLMKGYTHKNLTDEEKILNYRLSRGRRVVENTFGIMCSRSRVLLTTIMVEPGNVDKIVLASCAIHNFLRQELGEHNFEIEHESRTTTNIPPASWCNDPELAAVALPKGRNPTMRAKAARDYLKVYFNSPVGSIPWQDKVLTT